MNRVRPHLMLDALADRRITGHKFRDDNNLLFYYIIKMKTFVFAIPSTTLQVSWLLVHEVNEQFSNS